MEANGGQVLRGKGTQAHTARDIKRSKMLPTGKEEPQISTDGPMTSPPKTNHTDVITETHQDTTPVDLDKLANHPPDLNITANSRFESWTQLCMGTGRRYPNPNDVFRTISYSRRPRKFKQTPTARTNAECRICITLETSGNHEGALYEDHYGNFPTHCPHWTHMNINEKKKTALAARYCIRCFAPRVVVKTEMDVAKHHDTECYVRSTNKHKYTCLNNTCLLHSWICMEHSKENRPLIEAHHREAAKAQQPLPLLRPTT